MKNAHEQVEEDFAELMGIFEIAAILVASNTEKGTDCKDCFLQMFLTGFFAGSRLATEHMRDATIDIQLRVMNVMGKSVGRVVLSKEDFEGKDIEEILAMLNTDGEGNFPPIKDMMDSLKEFFEQRSEEDDPEDLIQ